MTAADICARVSVHEYWDWQRFAAIHPFPADLIDAHSARQAWLAASVHRAAGAPEFALSDFAMIRPTRAPPDAGPPMLEADRMLLALKGTDHGG